MAKSLLRIKARELRRKGKSIIHIAKVVGVWKSTVSMWCKDIPLTEQQRERLLASKKEGLKRGQLIGAELQRERHRQIIYSLSKAGKIAMKKMTKRDYFMTGLVLYWGEGAKKYNRVIFTNSDPKLIKLIVNWFMDFFSVPEKNFTFWVTINEIHRKRDGIVRNFWSDYLNVPLEQFCKTSFVKTKQNKIYENYDNYYGTLHMRILKSSQLLYRILGLISGILESDIIKEKIESRRSSVVRASAS